MTSWIVCKKEGCERTIKKRTAKRHDGYCEYCYIDINRKEINRFKGMIDPVEIIKTYHSNTSSDPLIYYTPWPEPIEKAYASLTQIQGDQLIDYVINLLSIPNNHSTSQTNEFRGDYEEIAIEISTLLACCTNLDLTTLQLSMLDCTFYKCPIVFKHASKTVTQRCLNETTVTKEQLKDYSDFIVWLDEKLSIDQILVLFSKTKSYPPDDLSEDTRTLPTLNYHARQAGWETTHCKKKRYLHSHSCYPLLPPENHFKNNELIIFSDHSEICQWCHGPLHNLFILDDSFKIFDDIGFKGRELCISTCRACSESDNYPFMDVTSDGKSSWSSFNKKNNFKPNTPIEIPNNVLNIGIEFRNPYLAANSKSHRNCSQIGGLPYSHLGVYYPECPNCQKTMKFVGQVNTFDLCRISDDIYHGFLCTTCMISQVRVDRDIIYFL